MRTLVVDDSLAIVQAVKAQLAALGVTDCDGVQNPVEALGLILNDRQKYQLIFVDLNMPEVDGMQFISHLSTLKFKGGVVILSSLDEKIVHLAAELSTSKRLHLIGSVSKPVTEAKLTAILQKMKTLQQGSVHPRADLDETTLRRAITQGWIHPYYQPKVSNTDGRVIGLEMLARICQPGKVNALEAAFFIPLCEQCDLVEEVTFQLLNQAMVDYPKLHAEFGSDISISLNLPPALLRVEKLPETLETRLKQHGIPQQALALEVTEGAPMDQSAQLETLGRLRIKGFKVSLDDFGTGFTNIRQMKELPFTELKLDRSLIYNISSDRLSQIIVQSLYDICGEMHLDVVAEGVERPEDLIYLNQLPMPLFLQGYIISRPKPLDDICRWHRSWQHTLSRSTPSPAH
jgi:EAL domain-containing protein (putative c-di-GMP-specific phosphodiesterase class I)/CheY-like chemotaxis protein